MIPGNSRIIVPEVESTCKIVPKQIMQVWTYVHLLNKYVDNKVAKLLILTSRGIKGLDRHYSRNDVANMIKLFM